MIEILFSHDPLHKYLRRNYGPMSSKSWWPFLSMFMRTPIAIIQMHHLCSQYQEFDFSTCQQSLSAFSQKLKSTSIVILDRYLHNHRPEAVSLRSLFVLFHLNTIYLLVTLQRGGNKSTKQTQQSSAVLYVGLLTVESRRDGNFSFNACELYLLSLDSVSPRCRPMMLNLESWWIGLCCPITFAPKAPKPSWSFPWWEKLSFMVNWILQ